MYIFVGRLQEYFPEIGRLKGIGLWEVPTSQFWNREVDSKLISHGENGIHIRGVFDLPTQVYKSSI